MSKRAGTRREYQVRLWLEERDFFVVRAAGSLGDADLVALKAGDRRLIEVKATTNGPYEHFGPADRANLLAAARLADATAWLAWWPPRGQLHWFSEGEWPQPRVEKEPHRVCPHHEKCSAEGCHDLCDEPVTSRRGPNSV